MIRVGINGFGRIGRLSLRAALSRNDLEVVAINDPFLDAKYMEYMLKYDSVHGQINVNITTKDNKLIINNKEIIVYNFKNPADIPWYETNANYILESSGVFTNIEGASQHLTKGVKNVLIGSPSIDAPTYVMGVNHTLYSPNQSVISNASCTTNCVALLAKVIDDNFGIKEGLMTTIHAATATQKTVDGPSNKDWRGGRSILGNIIPTSTGAARSVGLVLPKLQGKLTGMSFRVPVADVSVVDLTVSLNKKTSLKEINEVIKKASNKELKGLLSYTEDALVSSDLIGNTHTAIYDATAGIALNDQFVKLVAWYDNETGFANKSLDFISYIANVNKSKN